MEPYQQKPFGIPFLAISEGERNHLVVDCFGKGMGLLASAFLMGEPVNSMNNASGSAFHRSWFLCAAFLNRRSLYNLPKSSFQLHLRRCISCSAGSSWNVGIVSPCHFVFAPAFLDMESNRAFCRRRRGLWRRLEQTHDAAQNFDDGGFVDVEPVREALFEFSQLPGQLTVVGEHRAHLDEGAHDEDTHLLGARAAQSVGGHNRTVLGEGVGPVLQVVASL